MEDNTNKNPHKDYRSRVKTRFSEQGLSGFAPHEALELLLFYAVPQKDTNVLAHRLLDRFGSLLGVFGASEEELLRVEGVGSHVATLLRLVMPAASYALTEGVKKKESVFRRLSAVGQYLIDLYMGMPHEAVYLLLFDNAYTLLDCVKVHEGSVNSVSVTPRKLVECAYHARAAMAVLAHNHPGGIAVPSSEDINTTVAIKQAFDTMGITLLEHVLVAGERYVPLLARSRKLMDNAPERVAFYADAALEWEGDEA